MECTGGGHAAHWVADRLADAAAQVPVVMASRTGAGEMLRQTYDFKGSEIDLLARGLISAGWLDGLKARLLLTLAADGRAPTTPRSARPSPPGSIPHLSCKSRSHRTLVRCPARATPTSISPWDAREGCNRRRQKGAGARPSRVWSRVTYKKGFELLRTVRFVMEIAILCCFRNPTLLKP